MLRCGTVFPICISNQLKRWLWNACWNDGTHIYDIQIDPLTQNQPYCCLFFRVDQVRDFVQKLFVPRYHPEFANDIRDKCNTDKFYYNSQYWTYFCLKIISNFINSTNSSIQPPLHPSSPKKSSSYRNSPPRSSLQTELWQYNNKIFTIPPTTRKPKSQTHFFQQNIHNTTYNSSSTFCNSQKQVSTIVPHAHKKFFTLYESYYLKNNINCPNKIIILL